MKLMRGRYDFLSPLSALILLAVFATAAHAQQKEPWHQHPVKGIGTNIWAPEWYSESITKFDADKLAASLQRAGAEVAFTFQGFSQDHFGASYFPTRLGPQHRNLQGRDNLRDYVEACHKRNIKVLGYYSFPDKGVWDRNPDWHELDAKDQEIRTGNFGGPLCPNSPYREYFLARTSEVVQLHDLDGFMLDTAGFSAREPGCYCRYCQRKFRERYGRNLPRQHSGYDEDWRRFLQFRFDSMQEFYQDVHDAFKKIRPNMIFTHNAFALPELGWGVGEDYERSTRLDDIVTSIGHWGGTGSRGPTRNLDQIWKTGMLTRYLRGISGKQVWMQMGAFMYTRDYQALPVQELKQAAYTIVANGGSPVYIINTFPDGRVDEVLSDRMAAVFNDLAPKREFLDGATDENFAALYFSRDSQILGDSVHPGERRYRSSFEGAYKALTEEHVPFGVIGEAGLTPEKLSRYKVLLMPDAVVLGAGQSKAVEQFVRSGGALIGTSRTSLIDPSGADRTNFALSEVFGADYVNPLNYDTSFIKAGKHLICEGLDPRENIPHRQGQQIKVNLRPGAEIAARLMLPVTETVPNVRTFSFGADVAPGVETNWPAILTNSFGQGRSVYFAGDVTGAYGKYGDPSLRKLLRNAVRWANGGKLPLEVDGPLAVEVRPFRQGGRHVIHLMNYISSGLRLWDSLGGPAAEDVVPVHDIAIRVRISGGPKRVFVASTKQALKYEVRDGMVSFTVPKVDVHEMVVIE